MANKKGKVTRNFYYYDLLLLKFGQDESKSIIKDSTAMYYEAFKHIAELREKIKDGTEIPEKLEVLIDSGDKVYIIVDEVKEGQPIEFRLVLCRSDALPYVEKNGLLDFLTNYLPQDFSLAEITHCVIFPEYNIMGAEFNFSGARATSIKAYLPRVFSKIDYVYCANRLNSKVLDRLRKGEGFSLFQLAVKNNSEGFRRTMESRSIFTLPFLNIPEVDTFEITLKRRKGSKSAGFESPIPVDMLDGFIKDCRDDIKSFKISQGSIQNDAIDLLHDKLVKTSSITKTVNKTIDSKEAYHEIKTFFDTVVKFSI